jgi:hypothetical protein
VRIAKPILLVTTPIGLLEGFYECYELAGGVLFLMAAMVGVVFVAMRRCIGRRLWAGIGYKSAPLKPAAP